MGTSYSPIAWTLLLSDISCLLFSSPIAFRHRPKNGIRSECTRDRGIPQAQRGYAAKALVQRGMVRTLTRCERQRSCRCEASPRP
jgi:hypothetical protein